VRETLRRPLERLLGLSREEAEDRVVELLEAVHLTASYADRLPGQLSGGEKQRVAVARAFAPNPELLIADEPVSSLDVSVQASILNLFNELQAEHDISVLFISHDLAVVGYLADWIAVIYEGKLVEIGPSQAVFRPPYHPYTETLLASVPLIDPEAVQSKLRIEELVAEEAEGCSFGERCPRKRPEVCEGEEPGWWEDEETGKRIACHISMEELRRQQEPAYEFKTRRPTQVR
jgi:peptide/nickel transport system ATP-binding protein